MDFAQSLLDSLNNLMHTIWSYLPSFLLAAIVLIIGLIVAKVLRSAANKALDLLRIDIVAEKSGIDEFLRNGGLNLTAITLLSGLLYWFIILATVLFALDILGLQEAREFFQRIVFYMPNVFVAAIILIFGSLLSKVVRSLILTYLNNVGVQGANAFASAAHYAVLVFVIFVAAEQLSIGGELLVSAFQIAFGGIALAFGLAFGLGGKDVAKAICERIYASFTPKH